MEKKTRKKSPMLPILVIAFIVIIVVIVVITKKLADKKEKEEKQQIENSANEFLKDYEKEVIKKDNNNTYNTNTSTTYKDSKVIGTINIPKISLKLPVLQNKTKDSLYLEIGKLNTNGNTVIVGNNTTFSKLKNLTNGDRIFVINENGTSISYSVYKSYEVDSNDTSFLNRNVESKKELTLYTNNKDKTVVVLAEEK